MDNTALPEPSGDVALMDAVCNHLEPALGTVSTVLHEIHSEFVHIDVYRFNDKQRDYRTLVTTGMASRAMNVPPTVQNGRSWRFAELMVHLPHSWPIDDWEELRRSESFWPIEAMIKIARLPHEHETWIGPGHTIGGEDNKPLVVGTRLSAVLIVPPYLMELRPRIELGDGRIITF